MRGLERQIRFRFLVDSYSRIGMIVQSKFHFLYLHSVYKAAEAGTSRVHRQDVAGYSFNGRVSHYMLAGVDLLVFIK